MKDAIEEFKKYTNHYINLSDMCVLKVNHTFRVMNLCEEIAESLNLSNEDIELAKLCGLLHDIARFEQWKQYQTFEDLKSIDHGDYGIEILKENDFIRRFNQESSLDELIFKTIKNHNKYELEENLTEREKLFCKIVRDADKLDILYLYTTGEIHLDTNNEDFSDEVYQYFLNHKIVSRKLKKTKADRLAISLGFVFDLNFIKSFQILKENNYIDKEIDIYKKKSKNEEFHKKLENIRSIINTYIDRRCENVR